MKKNEELYGIDYSEYIHEPKKKDMEEEIDLFEHYHLLPDEVNKVLDKYSEMDTSYENCKALEKELNALGYSMDYGLDAVPYDLKKK